VRRSSTITVCRDRAAARRVVRGRRTSARRPGGRSSARAPGAARSRRPPLPRFHSTSGSSASYTKACTAGRIRCCCIIQPCRMRTHSIPDRRGCRAAKLHLLPSECRAPYSRCTANPCTELVLRELVTTHILRQAHHFEQHRRHPPPQIHQLPFIATQRRCSPLHTSLTERTQHRHLGLGALRRARVPRAHRRRLSDRSLLKSMEGAG